MENQNCGCCETDSTLVPVCGNLIIPKLGKNFTILYPNSGTKEHPAIVETNKIYELKNPFPGKYVQCRAEVLYNNEWCETGWCSYWLNDSTSVRAFGTRAVQVETDKLDKLVIATGKLGICGYPSVSGNSFNTMEEGIHSAPCRVLVWTIN